MQENVDRTGTETFIKKTQVCKIIAEEKVDARVIS